MASWCRALISWYCFIIGVRSDIPLPQLDVQLGDKSGCDLLVFLVNFGFGEGPLLMAVNYPVSDALFELIKRKDRFGQWAADLFDQINYPLVGDIFPGGQRDVAGNIGIFGKLAVDLPLPRHPQQSV